MEIILFIIGCYIFYALISGIIETIKQKIKDRVAKEVLKDFNYQNEKDKILKIAGSFIKDEFKCPACTGILKLRNGKYGQFWGCSNYPKCNFTRNNI